MNPLLTEALEIVRNANAACAAGDITPEQCREVILNTMQDVAEQMQVMELSPA